MILLGLTVLIALQAVIGSASAENIYVDSGDSIQTAVDNAHSGDTIIVGPGTYDGDIDISTENLTLMSSNPHEAIINADYNAFYIYEKNTTIKGFDIKAQVNQQVPVFPLAAVDVPTVLFPAQFKIITYLILV